jgi:hypothetical protein
MCGKPATSESSASRNMCAEGVRHDAVSDSFISQLCRSAIAGVFLDGVNVASLGLMAGPSRPSCSPPPFL